MKATFLQQTAESIIQHIDWQQLSRTTLVLDTGAAPFDLLNTDAAKLGPRAR